MIFAYLIIIKFVIRCLFKLLLWGQLQLEFKEDAKELFERFFWIFYSLSARKTVLSQNCLVFFLLLPQTLVIGNVPDNQKTLVGSFWLLIFWEEVFKYPNFGISLSSAGTSASLLARIINFLLFQTTILLLVNFVGRFLQSLKKWCHKILRAFLFLFCGSSCCIFTKALYKEDPFQINIGSSKKFEHVLSIWNFNWFSTSDSFKGFNTVVSINSLWNFELCPHLLFLSVVLSFNLSNNKHNWRPE